MTLQIVTHRTHHILVAGALALLSQGALGGEANTAGSEHEQLRVTAPRPHVELADPRIETDTSAVIEALNRRLAEDLEKSLREISGSRIELAISDVATRG